MPLTAEEKKKRKAEKKAEKLREAEQMKIKVRKDELAREVLASKDNVATHLKRWYLNNYAARFPHVKQDMEVAWHMFEHTLDVKEFIISELMDRSDESKIQEAMSWQDFSISVDDLINGFHQRIEFLNCEYIDNRKSLLSKATKHQRGQELAQSELEDYYKTVLYIMEENFVEASSATQGEFVTRCDEEAKKGQLAVEVITAALEKSLQTTISDIKYTLDEYKDSTEARRREIESLRFKDEYYMEMIKKQDSRMAKLFEEFSNLQGQVNAKQESRLVLADLKRDREETYTEYTDVRARLTRDGAHDNQQLLTLTSESNRIIQDLEQILEKGEKIIRLGALCRRLETEEEKVLPFGIPSDLPDELQTTAGEIFNPFYLFWRRYANANLIKQKLEPTLEDLYQENQELRDYLQTTFEVLSMTQV